MKMQQGCRSCSGLQNKPHDSIDTADGFGVY